MLRRATRTWWGGEVRVASGTHPLTGGDVLFAVSLYTEDTPGNRLVVDDIRAVHAVIRRGLVLSCHDLSEGGLAVAVAEMAFAGEIGAELVLDSALQAGGLADVPESLRAQHHGRPGGRGGAGETIRQIPSLVKMGTRTPGEVTRTTVGFLFASFASFCGHPPCPINP